MLVTSGCIGIKESQDSAVDVFLRASVARQEDGSGECSHETVATSSVYEEAGGL